MKYTVKYIDSVEKKEVERECSEFIFTNNTLYFHPGPDFISKSLHAISSYLVSYKEQYGPKYVFEGFECVDTSPKPKYEHHKVEIIQQS